MNAYRRTRPTGRHTRATRITAGALLARFALLVICAIWLLPTLGLFVNSLREKDELVLAGWWTALISHDANDWARTLDASAQTVTDGRYIISGNVFTAGNPHGTIKSFGDGFLGGNLSDHAAGNTITTPEGWLFTLDAAGGYVLSAQESFTMTTGKRFFYRATYPPRVTFENYREVFTYQDLDTAFLNTVTVTIPATVWPLLIATFAAYAFTWLDFFGRRALYVLTASLIVLPAQIILIPVLQLYDRVDLIGTYQGLWLVHTAFNLPLSIFLLRNYMQTLPTEMIECAQIDGASHLHILLRLVLPLSYPALASVGIFQFLWVWNDLLLAQVFNGQNPDTIVLMVRLREMTGISGYNWEILAASTFVAIAIPLVMFFALQRYFVRGLVAGAING